MTLRSFTENGLEFRRGTCSFRGQPVPATGGVQSYSLTVDPGHNFNGGSVFSGQSIEISERVRLYCLHLCGCVCGGLGLGSVGERVRVCVCVCVCVCACVRARA